jgi:predicted DNA-binding protein
MVKQWEGRNVTASINIPLTLEQELLELAGKSGDSFAAIVRVLIGEALEARERKGDDNG